MKSAKIMRVNLKDVLKGVLIAFFTVVLLGVYSIVQTGVLPDWTTLKPILISGFGAALAYIIKNFLSNSDNQFLVKEKVA